MNKIEIPFSDLKKTYSYDYLHWSEGETMYPYFSLKTSTSE